MSYYCEDFNTPPEPIWWTLIKLILLALVTLFILMGLGSCSSSRKTVSETITITKTDTLIINTSDTVLLTRQTVIHDTITTVTDICTVLNEKGDTMSRTKRTDVYRSTNRNDSTDFYKLRLKELEEKIKEDSNKETEKETVKSYPVSVVPILLGTAFYILVLVGVYIFIRK